jgi:Predicted nucleic acid-binding protein, contains PIN domain
MKVLFDTNILIDVLARRSPFYADSKKAMDLAVSGKIDGIVGAGSITDIHYVIRSRYRDAGDALALIADLVEIVRPADTAAWDVLNAIKSGNADFEDAVIAETAVRESANFIVTRNKGDFAKSRVPALLPKELVEKIG